MEHLTQRQREILIYILETIDENLYQPSMKDIQTNFCLATGTIQKDLECLKRAGVVGFRVGNRALEIPQSTRGWWAVTRACATV